MARVNHKLVKQRIEESRSAITDRQFFTSRLLAGHFEDMAMVQSRRYQYKRRVKVRLCWDPYSTVSAQTNNMDIDINAGHEYVTKVKGRQNRYQIVCGLFSHELGHILYTDFLGEQTRCKMLEKGNWFPYPPHLTQKTDKDNAKELLEYIQTDQDCRDIMTETSHIIFNIIEDGYIENRMLLNFPGTLGHGLAKLREQFLGHIPTVTELKEKEGMGKLTTFESIMQTVLCYVKFGEIKRGKEPYTDERIRVVLGLRKELDSVLTAKSSKDRFDVANRIMVRCWPYLKAYCEKVKEDIKAQRAIDLTITAITLVKKQLGALEGASVSGTGSTAPVTEMEGNAVIDTTATKRIETSSKADEELPPSDEEELSADETEPKEDGADSETDDDGETDTTDGDEESEAGLKNETGESETDETSEEEDNEDMGLPKDFSNMDNENDGENDDESGDGSLGEPENEETYSAGEHRSDGYPCTPDCLSDPNGEGEESYNKEYEARARDHSAEEIEELLDRMAEYDACKSVEGERLKALNELAQNISYGNIHTGIHVRVNRMSAVSEAMIDQYNQVAPQLLMISKQLQRSLIHALNDRRYGGRRTGLLLGRELDAHSLYRTDKRVFYKNNLPQEQPQMAVGLLLDESGSMDGVRSVYARASAIILYDFCHALGIPVMVYGHSTFAVGNKEGLDMYAYAEFEDIDGNDKYRLMDICARKNNRDGAALRYVAERLSKRSEAIKLLIVVSDGHPLAVGYSGRPAEEDMRGVKREYQKKGLMFVAAAIGSDKEDIERIYGDSFMDITDLKQLPVKLVSVVKKYIRV